MDGFQVALMPKNLLIALIGAFIGTIVGLLPGLGPINGVALLLPFAFALGLPPESALILLAAVYLGCEYGGRISAILINVPGDAAAIMSTLDGYPLAQKGKAGEAIGITTTVSFFGGMLGILVLATAAPIVSEFAVRVQPRDYMMLGVLGLLLVGSLSGESLIKGVFAGAFGIMIGTVGLDPLTVADRFTFGLPDLRSGISFVAVMIGMFGISEALVQLHDVHKEAVRQQISRIVPSWQTILKYLPLSLRCSAIGVIIGALPGTGGDIAALMAYDHAKRTVKNPEVPFGQGAIEGLVAPETANNAAVGGAYIPMMTLGIPGDSVTAIMIGALFIHGLNPVPMLMVDKPDMFWYIVGSLTLGTIFMLIFGLTGIRIFVKVVEMPRTVLLPIIVLLSIVGAFAVNNSLTDVYWMLSFGVLGYFMKLYGYELGPVILGVILSRLLDDNWRRAIISEQESLSALFLGIVKSPLSLVLFVSILFLLLSKTAVWKKLTGKTKAA